MKAVVVVTVAALDKNAGVTKALSVNLPSNVVQVHSCVAETTSGQDIKLIILCCLRCFSFTFADVSACILDCGVAVDIGQESEAEAVLVV